MSDGPADQQPAPGEAGTSVPAIAAAFLVVFDLRKGYTIAWQETIGDLKLDGVVEFKSLPSGLHNVEEDVVYFTHEHYVGVSAFVRNDDTEAARNAAMLAVGVMIPVEVGHMGKSWLHVPMLKQLAREQHEHITEYDELERYWDEHKMTEGASRVLSAAQTPDEGYQRPRAPSMIHTGSTRVLPAHHPALLLPQLLETFGPLIYPLFRAALLRKRILILGEAPVEITCNYVYNISLIASITKSLISSVPIDDKSQLRLNTLFNVGISDLDTLSAMKGGWIACTTDDVLCSKRTIFDLLIIMQAKDASGMQQLGNKRYPKLIISTPELAKAHPRYGLKATQRDAKRFQALKIGLDPLPDSSPIPVKATSGDDDDDAQSFKSAVSSIADKFEAIEPIGWPLMAYNSLIWWWSSGDTRSGLAAVDEIEDEQDRSLLQESLQDPVTTKEVALLTYFHQLSHLMFVAMGQAVKRSAREQYRDDPAAATEDEHLLEHDDEQAEVEVSEDDIRAMGLDAWSDNDCKFIAEMARVWWHRKAIVRGSHIDCCGLRIL